MSFWFGKDSGLDMRQSGGGKTAPKPKAKKVEKDDFTKQYRHLVKTINLLASELKDARKCVVTKADLKKLQVAEDRILNLV